ncbi:hypothetical protein [Pseudomonas putida]|uniref:Uncharacterized protein n=1 Tax=Pseudomonas putida TaxID=303 RepID=A0A8I1ECK7_PSEPU|nr:hypothetical protein [Pseudomonas putida]MBI6882798.1 hypothetical protein [Pseudomonas putida]
MSDSREIFKIGLQCLGGLLCVFALAFLVIQYHDNMRSGLAEAADWVILMLAAGFVYALPASPSLSAAGFGLAIWSTCFSVKLVRSRILTKKLHLITMRIWGCGLALGTIFLASFLIQSDSGTTALKIGLGISLAVSFLGMVFASDYRVDNRKYLVRW